MTARPRRTNGGKALRLAYWNADGVCGRKPELDKFLIEQWSVLVNQVGRKAAQRLCVLGPLLNRRSGLSIKNGVLLYKQLIRPMMDYAYPIWRSAAHTHARKLQVLQSKCLRIANNAPWYVSNRQIHDELGIPFFADHIRALAESFDSKLADAGNPLVRQLGRHLCQPRAGLNHLRATDED
jgi:hypothetical protein